MKKLLTLTIALLLASNIFAQNGVVISTDQNATTDPSAILDVQSTNKGVLIPRIDLTSPTQPIANPEIGLLVFNIDPSIYPIGFYYWTGDVWNKFTTDDDLSLNTQTNELSVGNNSVDLSQYLDDQTVTINGDNGIEVSGTYPDFTVANKPNETSRTIYFDTGMTTDSIQGLINSVDKYIPYGTEIIFQFNFGNGQNYNMENSLLITDFYGGGTITIQGNPAQVGTLIDDQHVRLVGNAGFDIIGNTAKINITSIYVENLNANNDLFLINNNSVVQISYCYFNAPAMNYILHVWENASCYLTTNYFKSDANYIIGNYNNSNIYSYKSELHPTSGSGYVIVGYGSKFSKGDAHASLNFTQVYGGLIINQDGNITP